MQYPIVVHCLLGQFGRFLYLLTNIFYVSSNKGSQGEHLTSNTQLSFITSNSFIMAFEISINFTIFLDLDDCLMNAAGE
jgi:hypothetical protein